MSNSTQHHINFDFHSGLTLTQKVGQLFMIAVFINDSEENIQKTEELITSHHIGALCFFHSRASAATNFEGKKKVIHNENSYQRLLFLVQRYQKAAPTPLLIAIDAEWGLAMRIENTPQYPYALTLGALQNREDLIQEVGYGIGLDCLEAGIHWNLAPVLDINSNPDNPVIGYRSFGDDKKQVTLKAKAFIKGMQKGGILNSLKHFPGHGDTSTDSHLALPIIEKSANNFFETELYPFEKTMHDADSIMIGHLSIPALEPSGKPATLSKAILSDLIREKLGYQGLVISDAMNMHAVSKEFEKKGELELTAFTAGMDMFCFSEHPKEGIEKIASQIDAKRIESSFERVWALKKKVFDALKTNIKPKIAAEQLNRDIAKACLTELFVTPKELVNPLSKDVVHITFGDPKNKVFGKLLERENKVETHTFKDLGKDLIQEFAQAPRLTILSVFPPFAKPKNNFGFAEEELHALNTILKKGNCILYLFGNPLFVHSLYVSKKNSYILMYQDFPEFQETAVEHLKGELVAKGKLPFQLKSKIHEK